MGLGEVGHSLSDFFGLGEEKGHVEDTSCIQELGCLLQSGTFFAIGSPLTAIGEVKEQLGGAACLPHWFPLAAHIRFRTVSTRLRTRFRAVAVESHLMRM